MSVSKTDTGHVTRRDVFKAGAVAAIGGLALASTARFGGGARAAAAPDAEQLAVELGEFYFQVPGKEKNAPITVKAGRKYEITFTNVGKVDHEIKWGRTATMRDGDYHSFETHLLRDVGTKVSRREGGYVESFGLEEIEMEVGTMAVLEVIIPAELKGEWEIACFKPGHYKAGHHAPFIVA